MLDRPQVICLTPVKNEAWILDRFIQCTSLWADHIIIVDQQSTDASRDIAKKYKKVTLATNECSSFNEPDRQRILIQEARKISGPRLLIALDADEVLTANVLNCAEWKTVLESPPGTIIKFQRIELSPGLETFWETGRSFPLGFIDDGSEHIGEKIHSPRVPCPTSSPTLTLHKVKVLHYQYTDWNRMKSKHRWYQCWERLNQPDRRAVDIYRQYHHMDVISQNKMQSVLHSWLTGYQKAEIDMTSIYQEPILWWDREVLSWFKQYGAVTFKREAIWDVDWDALADGICLNSNDKPECSDPRSPLEKRIHKYLKKTQSKPSSIKNKVLSRLLRILGW